MFFSKKIKINPQIPGYKSVEQLRVLGQLVKSLPWGAKIVELGSCAGRGTWAISKNSPPFSKVYAIDIWCSSYSFAGNGYSLDPAQKVTLEYFSSFTQDCTNIIPQQARAESPCIQHKINCLILDCDNGKDRNNYLPIWQAWLPFLADKALVIGANYYPLERPDEVSFAEMIHDELQNLKHEHGIWWSVFSRPSKGLIT